MDNNKTDIENARVFLQLAQQRRVHLSNIDDKYTGFVITLLVGLWSFFLKAYIDSQNNQPLYIFIPVIASYVLLLLWRWYSNYLDNLIVKIYPEILYYEQVLKMPKEYRLMNDLFKSGIKSIENLCDDQFLGVIKKLVKQKRIGSRGPLRF